MKALPSLASSASPAASPSRPAIASPLVSSTTPPASDEPSPTDLLLATPPTLLKLFALSAPVIHVAATFVQLVTWTHPSFFSSLLVLLGWWALCLFGYWIALYGLNAAVLLVILHKYFASARRTKGVPPSSLRHRQRPATLSPAAYAQLINSAHVLAEQVQTFRTEVVHPISLHFSLTPLRPSTPAPAYETAWLLVTSYPFYLLVTFLVPLRYLFLVAGSIAILWQAPFFTTLRMLLWRSVFVRWICRLAVGILRGGKNIRREWGRTRSGLGIPGLIGSHGGVFSGRGAPISNVVEEKPVKKPRSSSVGPGVPVTPPPASPAVAKASVAAPVLPAVVAEETALGEEAVAGEGEDVQVQFTVFENQRWWVGLDWTHALLPGERASWTDPDNNPANPPASFVLPPPSVAYVPSPTKADPNSRLKKTTEWRWLDPEWHVLRSAVPSVTLPVGTPAAVSPESSTSTGTGTAAASPPSPTFSRTLTQFAASAVSSPSSSPAVPAAPVSPTFVSPGEFAYADSPLFANWTVDDEGWQYGDNHFEKMGPRGGLGKYTRHRAWVRRAGLVERTERVAGPALTPAPAPAPGSASGAAAPAAPARKALDEGPHKRHDRGASAGSSPRRSSAGAAARAGSGGSSAIRSASSSSSSARKRTSLGPVTAGAGAAGAGAAGAGAVADKRAAGEGVSAGG